MIYSIIQPPFTLRFREMSKKDLKDYFEWFKRVMPERIQILTSAIKSTAGYEKWDPDFSPESLDLLGEWFLAHVETRPRTQEEIDTIQMQAKFFINIRDTNLTNKTFSLAVDIGMYMSLVFVKKNPALQWSQIFGNKKSVDYGSPVLKSFSTGPFNPVHMMVTLAYGLASGSKTGRSLRNIYDIWSKMVLVTATCPNA